MNVFCGIDLGSTTTKAVLLDEHGDILGAGSPIADRTTFWPQRSLEMKPSLVRGSH